VVFEARPAVVAQLQSKFKLAEDVFRVLFTEASAPAPVKA